MRLAQTLEVESPEVLGELGEQPKILTVEQVKARKVDKSVMLVESTVTESGLTLANAPPKTGKTLLTAQIGMSVAAGVPVLDYFPVLRPGPVLYVQKDDSSGADSVKRILDRTPIPLDGRPFHTYEDAQGLSLGADFADTLESLIRAEGYVLVVLDSWLALRPQRANGAEVVKGDESDLRLLDTIAKKHRVAILMVHHTSKGSVNNDWSEQAAGTYAVNAVPEGQILMTRFSDMSISAPERLVRIRGRRFADSAMVIRFNAETLGFDMVLQHDAAAYYPHLLQIKAAFGTGAFSPKQLSHEGMAIATAHRVIGRLVQHDAVRKTGFGEYRLNLQL